MYAHCAAYVIWVLVLGYTVVWRNNCLADYVWHTKMDDEQISNGRSPGVQGFTQPTAESAKPLPQVSSL